jgi:hypothetical protein
MGLHHEQHGGDVVDPESRPRDDPGAQVGRTDRSGVDDPGRGEVLHESLPVADAPIEHDDVTTRLLVRRRRAAVSLTPVDHHEHSLEHGA